MNENALQTTVSRSDSVEGKSNDIMSDQLKIIDDHFETEQRNNIDATSRHRTSSPVEHLVAAGNVDEKNVSQNVPEKVAEDAKNSDGACGMGDPTADDVSHKGGGVHEADVMEKSLNSQVKTEEPDMHGGSRSASAENKDQCTPALPSGDSGNGNAVADVSVPGEKEQDLGDKGTVYKENVMECDKDSAANHNKTAVQAEETGAETLHEGQSVDEKTFKLQSSPTDEVGFTPEKGWLTDANYSCCIKRIFFIPFPPEICPQND